MRSPVFASMMPASTVLAAVLLALSGCAAGDPAARDAGPDAQVVRPDAGPSVDAGEDDDAGAEQDAGAEDGGAGDAGADGGSALGDAGADAAVGDAGSGCGAISAGDTLTLDGAGDLAMYPSEQVIAPFAGYTSGDQMGVTWDADFLYVTLVTDGFMEAEGAENPLHLYVEAASGALPAATAGTGKEYDGLTAQLSFTPTHLIAVRRTSELGTSGPYNGVYGPSGGWATRSYPIELGADYWARTDGGAISVRVPWTALGCPTRLRLSAHVVNGPVAGAEWKDVVPAGAQPWSASDPGTHYVVDLTADPAISGWTEAP